MLQECKQPASNYMLLIFVYDAYLCLLARDVMESCLLVRVPPRFATGTL